MYIHISSHGLGPYMGMHAVDLYSLRQVQSVAGLELELGGGGTADTDYSTLTEPTKYWM